MPYIPKEERGKYNGYIRDITTMLNRLSDEDKSGSLNYVITKMLKDMYPARYNDFNMLIGVLEAMKLELYRRMVVPYEKNKIDLNGDVF